MRDLIAACAPVLPKALHPKLAAKAAIHHLTHMLAAPARSAHGMMSHIAPSRVYHAVSMQARYALRRHAYMAPKIVAQAKIAAVCTALGVGGGLGVGLGTGGAPSAQAFAGPTPLALPTNGEISSSRSGPPVQVPEPSSLTLLAIAGAALILLTKTTASRTTAPPRAAPTCPDKRSRPARPSPPDRNDPSGIR
jgi:hypothetical protein